MVHCERREVEGGIDPVVKCRRRKGEPRSPKATTFLRDLRSMSRTSESSSDRDERLAFRVLRSVSCALSCASRAYLSDFCHMVRTTSTTTARLRRRRQDETRREEGLSRRLASSTRARALPAFSRTRGVRRLRISPRGGGRARELASGTLRDIQWDSPTKIN